MSSISKINEYFNLVDADKQLRQVRFEVLYKSESYNYHTQTTEDSILNILGLWVDGYSVTNTEFETIFGIDSAIDLITDEIESDRI